MANDLVDLVRSTSLVEDFKIICIVTENPFITAQQVKKGRRPQQTRPEVGFSEGFLGILSQTEYTEEQKMSNCANITTRAECHYTVTSTLIQLIQLIL